MTFFDSPCSYTCFPLKHHQHYLPSTEPMNETQKQFMALLENPTAPNDAHLDSNIQELVNQSIQSHDDSLSTLTSNKLSSTILTKHEAFVDDSKTVFTATNVSDDFKNSLSHFYDVLLNLRPTILLLNVNLGKRSPSDESSPHHQDSIIRIRKGDDIDEICTQFCTRNNVPASHIKVIAQIVHQGVEEARKKGAGAADSSTDDDDQNVANPAQVVSEMEQYINSMMARRHPESVEPTRSRFTSPQQTPHHSRNPSASQPSNSGGFVISPMGTLRRQTTQQTPYNDSPLRYPSSTANASNDVDPLAEQLEEMRRHEEVEFRREKARQEKLKEKDMIARGLAFTPKRRPADGAESSSSNDEGGEGHDGETAKRKKEEKYISVARRLFLIDKKNKELLELKRQKKEEMWRAEREKKEQEELQKLKYKPFQKQFVNKKLEPGQNEKFYLKALEARKAAQNSYEYAIKKQTEDAKRLSEQQKVSDRSLRMTRHRTRDDATAQRQVDVNRVKSLRMNDQETLELFSEGYYVTEDDLIKDRTRQKKKSREMALPETLTGSRLVNFTHQPKISQKSKRVAERINKQFAEVLAEEDNFEGDNLWEEEPSGDSSFEVSSLSSSDEEKWTKREKKMFWRHDERRVHDDQTRSLKSQRTTATKGTRTTRSKVDVIDRFTYDAQRRRIAQEERQQWIPEEHPFQPTLMAKSRVNPEKRKGKTTDRLYHSARDMELKKVRDREKAIAEEQEQLRQMRKIPQQYQKNSSPMTKEERKEREKLMHEEYKVQEQNKQRMREEMDREAREIAGTRKINRKSEQLFDDRKDRFGTLFDLLYDCSIQRERQQEEKQTEEPERNKRTRLIIDPSLIVSALHPFVAIDLLLLLDFARIRFVKKNSPDSASPQLFMSGEEIQPSKSSVARWTKAELKNTSAKSHYYPPHNPNSISQALKGLSDETESSFFTSPLRNSESEWNETGTIRTAVTTTSFVSKPRELSIHRTNQEHRLSLDEDEPALIFYDIVPPSSQAVTRGRSERQLTVEEEAALDREREAQRARKYHSWVHRGATQSEFIRALELEFRAKKIPNPALTKMSFLVPQTRTDEDEEKQRLQFPNINQEDLVEYCLFKGYFHVPSKDEIEDEKEASFKPKVNKGMPLVRPQETSLPTESVSGNYQKKRQEWTSKNVYDRLSRPTKAIKPDEDEKKEIEILHRLETLEKEFRLNEEKEEARRRVLERQQKEQQERKEQREKRRQEIEEEQARKRAERDAEIEFLEENTRKLLESRKEEREKARQRKIEFQSSKPSLSMSRSTPEEIEQEEEKQRLLDEYEKKMLDFRKKQKQREEKQKQTELQKTEKEKAKEREKRQERMQRLEARKSRRVTPKKQQDVIDHKDEETRKAFYEQGRLEMSRQEEELQKAEDEAETEPTDEQFEHKLEQPTSQQEHSPTEPIDDDSASTSSHSSQDDDHPVQAIHGLPSSGVDEIHALTPTSSHQNDYPAEPTETSTAMSPPDDHAIEGHRDSSPPSSPHHSRSDSFHSSSSSSASHDHLEITIPMDDSDYDNSQRDAQTGFEREPIEAPKTPMFENVFPPTSPLSVRSINLNMGEPDYYDFIVQEGDD
ncbi:hypothetical protein BLNAU_16160 [Blattamonas nauphoetae]|uniref:Trichohyalin n=1 Tax=Blattamonas nauphoetae TaxID=2049346 RepID=A0ABQ9XE59_9EUKA|nr:hypothetical protein BLNAU_16160 [Blattamonas nauphoetae]